MKFIPSKDEIEIIRRCAAREAGIPVSRVVLEPGCRYNTKCNVKPSINIALVSNDPSWGDTDLADYARWIDFSRGVDLTPDGRGIFDFYIRARGDAYRELLGNVVASVSGHHLARVDGYGHNGRPLWVKES